MADHTVAEEWRPVVGWEGRYSVSSHGRVRGPAGIVLRTHKHDDGYPTLSLRSRYKDRTRRCQVHTLVLEAFVGPRPNGYECRHIDGNPSNCLLTNLAWGTKAENELDKRRHGSSCRGEKNPNSVLDDHKVVRILELLKSGVSQRRVATAFGVSQYAISRINKGTGWTHIAR